MDKEVFFSDDVASSTADNMVRRGEARRLARGVFTTDLKSSPEEIVRRNWIDIVGHLVPRSVVTDRSARTGSPVEGVVYLSHEGRDRHISLPGLEVAVRSGTGPLTSDIAYSGQDQLFIASRERGVLENAQPSRSRKRAIPRRLTRHELAEWIDHLCSVDGEDALNELRDRAKELAPALHLRPIDVAIINELVGTALGTKSATDIPRALAARRSGFPYDQFRLTRVDLLVAALRSAAPQSRPAPDNEGFLPFFEAYFSNFIEGTEFTIEEASGIVFDGKTPANRSADAHDILGTYQVVSNRSDMSTLPSSPEEFVELMRQRHGIIMAGRPEKNPGVFKTLANRAGSTHFVLPPLVEGTLREGFARSDELDTAWERAVLFAFLVAEVHPFDDGNGRISRVMMNAELVAAGQSRIIIPTAFRSDYLGALRRLSRSDDPSVLIKALRYVHDWTASIDFSDFGLARDQLAATNAFEDPESGNPLRLHQLPSDGVALIYAAVAPTGEQGNGGDVVVRAYSRGAVQVRPHRRRRPSGS